MTMKIINSYEEDLCYLNTHYKEEKANVNLSYYTLISWKMSVANLFFSIILVYIYDNSFQYKIEWKSEIDIIVSAKRDRFNNLDK